MDSNQLKHNPFNIVCLSLIEINRPSIVFRHCVKIQIQREMRRFCCCLFWFITPFEIFHMKYETKTHKHSLHALMRCKFETPKKKVSGLKCITRSEAAAAAAAAVTKFEMMCACKRMHSSYEQNKAKKIYFHFLCAHARSIAHALSVTISDDISSQYFPFCIICISNKIWNHTHIHTQSSQAINRISTIIVLYGKTHAHPQHTLTYSLSMLYNSLPFISWKISRTTTGGGKNW